MFSRIFLLMITYTLGFTVAAQSRFQFFDFFKSIPTLAKTAKHILNWNENDDIVRFFVIGDFGEISNLPGVRNTSTLMNNLAKKNIFDFIITVGDNFYDSGIDDITDRSKPDNITSLFKKDYLKDLPIYATLGNHDCYSNATNEILYHQYNHQWNMPSDYYELVTPLRDDPSMNFVNLMLNSCKLLCPDNKYKMKSYCESMKVKVGSYEVMQQYTWLEEKLEYYTQQNTTAWLAVTFHHPPFLESSLKEMFLPMVRKYGIDFIFIGHEHWSEYANMAPDYKTRFPEETPKILINCTSDTEILVNTTREHTFKKNETLHQFMSGNGGHTLESICPLMEQDGNVYFKNDGYYGITTVEATSKKATVTYYRDVNDVVYKINIEA